MDFQYLFTEFEIGGNKLWRILALFAIILIALIAGKIAKLIIHKSVAALESQQRHLLAITLSSINRSVFFLFAAIGISIGVEFLELQNKIYEVADTLTSLLISIAIGYLLYWLVDVPVKWMAETAEKTHSKLDDMLIPIIRKSLRVTIVILLLVQIAQILSDKPITSIIAGLGIGGLAVALAAQDTIKNFFGSIVLFADKPFEMGNRIVVDGHDGAVEEVGIRSTKIRTLDGHLVTIPNGKLADMTIKNITKRPFIRRLFSLTVTYDTPPEKIEKGIALVKEILADHEGLHADFPPRVYFNDLNADSLNILVIYWYHPPDYWKFMAFTEKVNLQIMRAFEAEGIEFAFPTQTTYLAQDDRRPLHIRVSTDAKASDRGGPAG
jgi:MscS family membrane protein